MTAETRCSNVRYGGLTPKGIRCKNPGKHMVDGKHYCGKHIPKAAAR